jgi:hypothetical protein
MAVMKGIDFVGGDIETGGPDAQNRGVNSHLARGTAVAC